MATITPMIVKAGAANSHIVLSCSRQHQETMALGTIGGLHYGVGPLLVSWISLDSHFLGMARRAGWRVARMRRGGMRGSRTGRSRLCGRSVWLEILSMTNVLLQLNVILIGRGNI